MEAVQETGNLIASDKVQGTNVYNAAGENLVRTDPSLTRGAPELFAAARSYDLESLR